MLNASKTYILDDQWTDKDALADVIQTGNTPLTIGMFGTWAQVSVPNVGYKV